MFPFAGGIIGGRDRTLLIPGQDSPYFASAASSGQFGSVEVGLRFESFGNLNRLSEFGVAPFPNPDMWIHSDSQEAGVGDLYQIRVVNLAGDTSAFTGPTSFVPISTSRQVSVLAAGGPQDLEINTVTGTIIVQEIANPINQVSGNFSFTAIWEGEPF